MRSTIMAAVALAVLALVPAGCVGNASSAKVLTPEQQRDAAILAKAEPGQEIKTEDPNNPVVCRNEADATTRIRKYKSCKPKSEWDRIERESRESVENSIKNSGHNIEGN